MGEFNLEGTKFVTNNVLIKFMIRKKALTTLIA